MRLRDRAALWCFAFVVCAIPAIASVGNNILATRATRGAGYIGDFVTELREVTPSIGKDIGIFSPSPKVKVATMGGYRIQIGCRKLYRFPRTIGFGSDEHFRAFFRSIMHGEIARHFTSEQLNMSDFSHGSGWSASSIAPREKHLIYGSDQGNVKTRHGEKCSLCGEQSIFGQGVSRVYSHNLGLHLSKGLTQGFAIAIQSPRSQLVRVPNLQPLETRKPRISEQEQDAEYLQAKFGVFPPFVCAFLGICLCWWGLWRLRRCTNGRQFAAGFAALGGGFVFGCVSGIIGMLIAF
jgi:hypothetical protein